jgi:hypothetical protein
LAEVSLTECDFIQQGGLDRLNQLEIQPHPYHPQKYVLAGHKPVTFRYPLEAQDWYGPYARSRNVALVMLIAVIAGNDRTSSITRLTTGPNPLALSRRIDGEHPELDLIPHCDFAVRLSYIGKRHSRRHRVLGMLCPVFRFVQHTHVSVVGSEMPGV